LEAFQALGAVQAWLVLVTFLAATSVACLPLVTVLAFLGASLAVKSAETSAVTSAVTLGACLPFVAIVVLASVEAFQA
jgi:hypothetical protein